MGTEILAIPDDYVEEFCTLISDVLQDDNYRPHLSEDLIEGLGGWVKKHLEKGGCCDNED